MRTGNNMLMFEAKLKKCLDVYQIWLQVHENTELLVRFRDNIMTIQNQMRSIPGLMQRMPPIPAKLNTALASMFLPKSGGNVNAARGQPIFQSALFMAPNVSETSSSKLTCCVRKKVSKSLRLVWR